MPRRNRVFDYGAPHFRTMLRTEDLPIGDEHAGWPSQWGIEGWRGSQRDHSARGSETSKLGSSHPCPVGPHRPQATGAHGPGGPPSSTPPGQALPVTLYRDNTSRISQDPIGIDDPLSSSYGMSPKENDDRLGAAGRH